MPMLSRLQKKGFVFPIVVISALYERVGRVQSVKAGVVSTSSQKEVVDLSKENSRFNIADFSILNLSAVGADKVLRPVQFGAINVDNFIRQSNEVLLHVRESQETAS